MLSEYHDLVGRSNEIVSYQVPQLGVDRPDRKRGDGYGHRRARRAGVAVRAVA